MKLSSLIIRVRGFLVCSPAVLTITTEFEGRHPCVVNHTGDVLHFAGEDKDALADTAPPRKRPVKSNSRANPAIKKRQAKHRAGESDSDNLSVEDSIEEPVSVPSPHFVHAALPSPSGNHRKRTRVESSAPRTLSGEQGQPSRQVKPVPARNLQEPRKRKRSIAEAPQNLDQLIAFPHHQWQHVPENTYAGQGRGESIMPMQHGGRADAPMYPQAFNPTPFAPHAAYPGQGAFPQHAYPPGFYQPPYGQQQWNPPVNAAHQVWQGGPQTAQAPYLTEEMAAFLESRRGGGR